MEDTKADQVKKIDWNVDWPVPVTGPVAVPGTPGGVDTRTLQLHPSEATEVTGEEAEKRNAVGRTKFSEKETVPAGAAEAVPAVPHHLPEVNVRVVGGPGTQPMKQQTAPVSLNFEVPPHPGDKPKTESRA